MRFFNQSLALLLLLGVPLYGAAPVVSNVTTQILPDRKVQINYDVSDADGNPLSIFMRISADGGTTFDVPVRTVSGDISPVDFITNPEVEPPLPSIAPGIGKQIIWDGTADWPNKVIDNALIEVIARDSNPKYLWVDLGNGASMKFVWIPPGSFAMGSSQITDARPVHTVTLSEGFYMAETELTEAQWAAIRGGESSNLPKRQISRDDVQGYITALHQKENRNDLYSLPTEAQWEYACRAGSTTRWSFGDDEDQLGNYAWFSDNSSSVQPVGLKLPNPWGLFDMHGNVREWVQDWYAEAYYSQSPLVDPLNVFDSGAGIVRGGSTSENGSSLESAARTNFGPSSAFGSFGARLIRKAP